MRIIHPLPALILLSVVATSTNAASDINSGYAATSSHQVKAAQPGPRGLPGVKGATGLPGAKRATGPRGAKGDAGSPGEVRAAGTQGPIGKTGPKGLRGSVGQTGPAGITGEKGPAGPIGEKGSTGATGKKGPAGTRGATGPAGPEGAMGPAGPAGTGAATPCTKEDKRCGMFVTQTRVSGQLYPINSIAAGYKPGTEFGRALGDELCVHEGSAAVPNSSWRALVSDETAVLGERSAGGYAIQADATYYLPGTSIRLSDGTNLLASSKDVNNRTVSSSLANMNNVWRGRMTGSEHTRLAAPIDNNQGMQF